MSEKRYLHNVSVEEFREIFHEELFGAKRGEEDPDANIKVIVTFDKKEEKKEEPAPIIEEPKQEEAAPVAESASPAEEEAGQEETEEAKVLGKYEVYEEETGFKYRLKANNGEILIVSNSYTTKEGAHKGITTLQEWVEEGKLSFYTDKNDYSQWRLFTANGNRMIACGEFYSSKASAENSFESVKRFYKTEKVVDLEEIPASERREWLWKGDKDEDRGGGKFNILHDEETDEYQAQLLANNGEILFTTSNSYSSKDSLKEAIKTISSLIHENGFLIRKDKQGRYQFVVTSSNGVLVLGESYSGGDSARSAANSVLCFLDQAEWLDPDVDPDLDLEMK